MFYSIATIAPICDQLHVEGKKLVLATGFFDLLHVEHINFLAKAKAVGDILIVAVESDARARATKGEGRPVEPQLVRCQHLLDLRSPRSDLSGRSDLQSIIVDYVIMLPADFNNFEAYDSLISAVRPTVYAVSSHTTHLKSKTFLVEKYGGKLKVVHALNLAVSTTKIIETGILSP
jgi:cytidyltransferase-like protein